MYAIEISFVMKQQQQELERGDKNFVDCGIHYMEKHFYRYLTKPKNTENHCHHHHSFFIKKKTIQKAEYLLWWLENG